MTASREQALEWVLEKIAKAKAKGVARVKVPVISEEEKKRQIASKKPQEVELWKKWKDGGKKPEDLTPLLKSFKPMIQARVNVFRGSEVPSSAIEQKNKEALYTALDTWNPSKGTQLQTWVWQHFKRTQRFVDENKNFARIPENISKNIGPFNALKAELAEQLGHEPDVQTIHDHIVKNGHEKLGILSKKDIIRLNRDQRKSLIQKGFEMDYMMKDDLDPRDEEVKHLIVYELTPDERTVHEFTFGLNGHPQLSPGDIAKRTGFDPTKVSKLRTSIHKKMLPYLNR